MGRDSGHRDIDDGNRQASGHAGAGVVPAELAGNGFLGNRDALGIAERFDPDWMLAGHPPFDAELVEKFAAIAGAIMADEPRFDAVHVALAGPDADPLAFPRRLVG